MTILEYIELFVSFLNSPFIKNNISTAIWIFIAIAAFLEFSRIKISPLTWCLKKIGNIMNSDVNNRLDKIEERLSKNELRQEELECKEDLRETLYARRRILRANDEICNKVHHSKEFYNEIMTDIQIYEEYCAAHNNPKEPWYFRNDKCTESIHNIRRVYRELEKTNDFLSIFPEKGE